MPSGLKIGWQAWIRSLRVLAGSPLYVFALAAIAGLWCLAGYKWLGLPESSAWVLGLAVAWFLGLAGLAVGMLAGTVASVSAVAAGADRHLSLRRILNFQKRRFSRAVIMAVSAITLALILDELFVWINGLALPFASFLTFHLQRPLSHILIGEIFSILEALLWIFSAGLMMTGIIWFLNRPGAGEKPEPWQTSRLRGLVVFFSGLISAILFGGMAWGLATWRPVVKPGGWDYAQLLARNGAASILLAAGWLFWALTLAHITISPVQKPRATPHPS